MRENNFFCLSQGLCFLLDTPERTSNRFILIESFVIRISASDIYFSAEYRCRLVAVVLKQNTYGLRPDQLYEIQAAFHEFDVNHNGYITGEEMRQSLQRYHIRFNDFDVQRVLGQMDSNHDGRVNYD